MNNLLYRMYSTKQFHYYLNSMGTITTIPRQAILEPKSLSIAKDMVKEVPNG